MNPQGFLAGFDLGMTVGLNRSHRMQSCSQTDPELLELRKIAGIPLARTDERSAKDHAEKSAKV